MRTWETAVAHQRCGSCQKYNQAQVLGWVVLRFTPQQLASGEALPMLKEMLT